MQRSYNAGGGILLVLTRRVGERIIVGPSVIISVTESGGGKTTLEITTPLSILLTPEHILVHQQVASPGIERPPVEISRQVDDGFKLGAEIEVMVVSAKNEVVKLGVKAPRHVQILREELYEKIAAEIRTAAEPSAIPELPEDIRKKIEKKDKDPDTGV